jgi:TonB family protein
MSRRRRQKNSLLPKVFAIAVLVNAVAVLIAAQFGALKAIQREFGPANVVLIAPAEAPKEKEKPAKKKETKAAPVRKAAGANAKSARSNHPKTNLPAVVTAGPSNGEDSGSGPVADSGGGLKPGEIPTIKNGGGEKPKPDSTADTVPKVEPKPEVKPETKPEVKPEPKPQPVVEPKFVDAEPISQPQPAIPDDLLTEDLSKDYIAELEVGPDGVPTSAKTVQSTGIDELDRVALDTARKWRFSPATLGGAPTDQTVRVKIQFRVQ